MKQLLILHGAIGASSQFNELKNQLTHQFEVATLDFEGHGNRKSNRTFSIDYFVENVKDYLAELKWNKPLVFGYSMGGYVALKLEAVSNGTFEKIFTLGTKFDWNPEQAQKESQMLNPTSIALKIPAFATYLQGLHGRGKWDEVLEKTANMMLELGDNPALNEQVLSRIQTDVILLRGEKDSMVSEFETVAVKHQLSHSEYLEIPNWQHPIDRIPVNELAQKLQSLFSDFT